MSVPERANSFTHGTEESLNSFLYEGPGKMVASFEAVPFAQFLSRPLQLNVLSAWDKRSQSLDSQMHLHSSVLQSLHWWMLPRTLETGGKKIIPFLGR